MGRKDGRWWKDKYGVYNTRWIATFDNTPPVKIVFHSNRDYMTVGCKIVVSSKGLWCVYEVQGKQVKLTRDVPRPVTAYPSASVLK